MQMWCVEAARSRRLYAAQTQNARAKLRYAVFHIHIRSDTESYWSDADIRRKSVGCTKCVIFKCHYVRL